jgi:integrase
VAIKLTKRVIDGLPAPDPSGKQRLVWDAELKGFGLLVSGVTSAKTYIAQRKLPGGLTRRVTVGSVAEIDLNRARAMAADLLNDMRHGRDPKAARRSAAQWTLRRGLEDYLKANKRIVEKTRQGYRSAVEGYLKDWLDLPLGQITPDMVEARHRKIQEGVEASRREAARKAEREAIQPKHWNSSPGSSTANGVMRALRAVWNHVAERAPDLPPTNPVRRLRRQWYAEPRRERMVSSDDLPRFYAAVDALGKGELRVQNRTASDFLKAALFTGLRRGELTGLRWDEVDFAARVIRLPAKRMKAGRRLDLPMSSFVRDLLVARRALGDDGPFVFAADSRSGHLEEPRAGLDPVAEATGIRVSCHDLRRVFITVAEETDISVMALKALVAHAIGGDVTAGYVQLSVERLRAPAQRVGDRMMELCGIEGFARVG